MKKVVTINLNGNAYVLEDDGYEALRAYLDEAGSRLAGNPDRDEIVSDLEQAIADKCRRCLGSHKSVVTGEDIARILTEMGPVNAADDDAAGADSRRGESTARSREAPRRLYQVREGAMISGVCNGLAAYFNMDVTLVRIIFVVLGILTSGGWILAYILMMFVIPYAKTSEERAAARGQPFNAQELVDRAKQQYAEFRENSSRWHERWRRDRQLRREQRAAAAASAERSHWQDPKVRDDVGYATRLLAGFMVPVFTILSAVLFVVVILAILSLVVTGGVFYWTLPGDIPLWVAILIVAIVYQAVHAPLRAASRASYETSAGPRYGWLAAADAIMWLGFAALFFWLAYMFVPEVRYLFDSLPSEWKHFAVTWNW
jgi:phage shock protein PspC (stress-responsive transcriptional regulator)